MLQQITHLSHSPRGLPNVGRLWCEMGLSHLYPWGATCVKATTSNETSTDQLSRLQVENHLHKSTAHLP